MTPKREPGAPPDPCDECNGEGIVTRAFATPHDQPCPKCAAPVAGSASFSALLDAYARAVRSEERKPDWWKADLVAAARARVEDAYREAVERERARGDRQKALREECEKASYAAHAERDRLNAALFRASEVMASLHNAGGLGLDVHRNLEAEIAHARAVLGARPVPSGDHPNSSNEEGA